MEMDFELNTIAVTLGMWAFILFVTWKIDASIRNQIVLTVASLPIIYFIVLWQKSKG